jgi:polar amino acid transport system permease protein
MKWSIIWDYRDLLWHGLLLTLQLSVVSIVSSTVVGVIIGCVGSLPGFLAQRLVRTYVEGLRNIPVVVKMFFFYFAAGLDAIPAALVSLTLHQSAYIADMLAAGFRAVPREQFEAAYACGHTRLQSFTHILLPQVFRNIIPPMTTQYIEVVKNSAIAMMIGIEELTFQTQHIEAETFRGFEAATAVTLAYIALALIIAALMSALAKHLRVERA